MRPGSPDGPTGARTTQGRESRRHNVGVDECLQSKLCLSNERGVCQGSPAGPSGARCTWAGTGGRAGRHPIRPSPARSAPTNESAALIDRRAGVCDRAHLPGQRTEGDAEGVPGHSAHRTLQGCARAALLKVTVWVWEWWGVWRGTGTPRVQLRRDQRHLTIPPGGRGGTPVQASQAGRDVTCGWGFCICSDDNDDDGGGRSGSGGQGGRGRGACVCKVRAETEGERGTCSEESMSGAGRRDLSGPRREKTPGRPRWRVRGWRR